MTCGNIFESMKISFIALKYIHRKKTLSKIFRICNSSIKLPIVLLSLCKLNLGLRSLALQSLFYHGFSYHNNYVYRLYLNRLYVEVDTHHKRNNLDNLQQKVYVTLDRCIDVVFCIRLSTNLALYLQVMIYVIYMLVVFSFIFRKLLSINISILRHI